MSNQNCENISVVINGHVYTGRYYVEKGIVHVSSGYGTKATQLGTSREQMLANRLLSEIIREHYRHI